ncbi:MAG: hypothetical protein ACI4AX_02760 [Muribaculaceae bacterium]
MTSRPADVKEPDRYHSLLGDADCDRADVAARLSDYYWDIVMPEYLDDPESRALLFHWTSVASLLDPDAYTFRMGWIYADGIGCERDTDKAVDFFTEAYASGDWRGAKAIARMLEEHLDDNPGIVGDERRECEREIAGWHQRAYTLREEQFNRIISHIDRQD